MLPAIILKNPANSFGYDNRLQLDRYRQTERHECHIVFIFLPHKEWIAKMHSLIFKPTHLPLTKPVCKHDSFWKCMTFYNWFCSHLQVIFHSLWLIFCILCPKCHVKLNNIVLRRSEIATPSGTQQAVLAVACIPIWSTRACLCVQDCTHICRFGGRTVGTSPAGA